MGARPEVQQIFREHHDFVWRVVLRLGVPEAGVDDVVQEVFVVLHRRWNELDHAPPVRSLLYGIARRLAKQQRERNSRRARLLSVAMAADEGRAPSPQATVELREMADLLARVLDELDEDKRMTFVLADIEGLSAPEIAAAMEANLNTVYARLRAARRLVAEGLGRLQRETGGRRAGWR